MKFLPAIPYALLAMPLVTTLAIAKPEATKMFGAAAPFTIDKLPTSRLKSRLQSLPAPAQQRAMKWLHSFNFPEDDIEFLGIDSKGAVFYQDTLLPENTSQVDLEANPTLEGINPVDAFKLHSKPGAPNVVYINFMGHTLSGTAWNDVYSSLQAKPFSRDSNFSSFSAAEKNEVAVIWHRIAEDLAPFDIDVTTEKPASFGPKTGHILITSHKDASGKTMPAGSAGGVAYVGVWGRSNYPYYQPALVYYDNFSSIAFVLAEAASHEFGHNLYLSHDGSNTTSYYTGHGSGLTSWGPIMGLGYYANVTQWSKGEYSGANNTQDDLAIIRQRLNYRADDHGNDQASATALLVDVNGYIASSNPEFDPLNLRPDNKGVIETRSDKDVFSFDTGAGNINISITPAWDTYTGANRFGANLDIQAKITDSYGTVIIDEPLNDTDAVIDANLSAGRYYLEITGVGNAGTPYSDYASIGQYFISGSVVSLVTDDTPPSPNPMSWAANNYPAAISKTSISMTAVNATDNSGSVEYQFICVAGGQNCTASSWQNNAAFIATGLQTDTDYSYQVKARDSSGNETALSSAVTATTLINLAPQSQDDYATVDENTAAIIDVLANDMDPDGDVLQISSTGTPGHGDLVISGDKIIYTPDTDYVGTDSFSYTVTDGAGAYSISVVDIEVIEVNYAPIARSDSAEVLRGGSVTIDVLANDTDPEGSPLIVVAKTNGSKGSARINASGTITYTASGKKRGGDSFTYTISDGQWTSTAVVNIAIVRRLSNVSSVNDADGGTKCHPRRGC